MTARIQPATRPLRQDAARNRERVVEAAAALFAERGMSVGVPEVAERAGVGKATVYRSFPSKENLIAAVLEQRMEWSRERAELAAQAPDAGAAFRELLFEMAEVHASDHALADAMAYKTLLPELAPALEAVRQALDRLVARAQEQGSIRPDVTGAEVRVLLSAVTRAMAEAGEHDPAVWRRHLSLMADGLRSGIE
jgi:AcrR family transcriptional regulator